MIFNNSTFASSQTVRNIGSSTELEKENEIQARATQQQQQQQQQHQQQQQQQQHTTEMDTRVGEQKPHKLSKVGSHCHFESIIVISARIDSKE
jgi:hypothetical protein